MKQFRNKNTYYLLVVMLLTSVYSCQHDETIQNETEQATRKVFNFEAKKVAMHTLFKENKDLDRFISSKFLNNDINDENVNSSMYGFSIDTTKVQVISADTYISYTFIAERETTANNLLENYVLTVFSDGGYTQMLVTYPYEYINNEIQFSISNGTAQHIVDDTLLVGESTSPCPSTVDEIVEWEDIECVAVNCGELGNHPPSQPCNDGVQRSYWECTGGWVVTGCRRYGSGSPSGGTGTGTASTPTGGGTTTTNDTTTDDEIPVMPFFDLGLRGECNKINNLFTEHPNYRQQLITLETKTNLDHETAIGIYDDNTEFEIAGTSSDSNVYLGEDPPSKYKSLAHVHNEFISATDTITTYSVFSVGDLQYMAKRVRENKVNTNEFVAFLATGKGTRYALTINNVRKFKEFFKYLDILREMEAGNATKATELSLYFNTKVSPILKKYYDNKQPFDPVTAPIKVENTNNNAVLVAFLNFMRECDFGASLFEVDATYTVYKNVTLDRTGTSVVRENCNN